MESVFDELIQYMASRECISTHCHHMPDNFMEDYNLDRLLKHSYVSWAGVRFDNTPQGRKAYLDKVRYKSYFIWLQMALQDIYHFEGPLTADNWTYWSDTIRQAHTDKNRHMDLLKSPCKYSNIVLDTYWDPGSNNGHPDLFKPTFRIDPFLFGYAPEINDLDGNSISKYGYISTCNIDEYIAFMNIIINNKIQQGCVSMKCAVAYGRGLDFCETNREKAQRALEKGSMSSLEDIKHFQDYVFFQICRAAAEFDIPLQCHTGLGKLEKSNPMQLQEVISKNPDTKFVLFHCGYPWLDDIGGLLHVYPNVYPDLCWLPIISPTAAVRMLHELIEVGTADKVCWGCDTWTSEESYGALLAFRHVLASALSSKIRDGYLTISHAHEIVDNLMYRNAKELYKL